MTNTNSPIDFFSSISDPRVERTQKYSLDAILLVHFENKKPLENQSIIKGLRCPEQEHEYWI